MSFVDFVERLIEQLQWSAPTVLVGLALSVAGYIVYSMAMAYYEATHQPTIRRGHMAYH